jgi:peptidyl-prolyl cis-trans isomerase SDCCAG10
MSHGLPRTCINKPGLLGWRERRLIQPLSDMSSVYVLEPRTSGRAVLRTSHGPVSVSLWCTESPLATRNFLMHASAGYYDGLPFHRVVPGLLVQTGDPTRTGHGGVAAGVAHADKGIPSEAHGRLKFRRRGIVALVADDDSGQCRSQFFITLARADWLDGKHTIIGHVDGDTIFNVLSMANQGEIDGFDIPDAPKLLSVEFVLAGCLSPCFHPSNSIWICL